VQLLKHKCLPILLYALEVCNLDRRKMQSLNRFFMKLFKMSNLEIVRHCQTVFGCELPSVCRCRSDLLNLLRVCQLIIDIVNVGFFEFSILSRLYCFFCIRIYHVGE